MKKWYVHQTDDKGLAEKLEAVAAEWGQGWPRWYKIDSYLYKTTSPTDTTSYDRKDGSVVTHNDMNYDEHLRNGGGDPIPAAEGEALVAAAKDPYPHYYHDGGFSTVVFSSATRGVRVISTNGTAIDETTICEEDSFTRITKAEFDARVEAAEEKGRWAEGSMWTTDDNYTSLLEFDADDHCVRHSKSARGMWGGGTWERYQVSEITPTRAREILAGWKAAREVRCFEYVGITTHPGAVAWKSTPKESVAYLSSNGDVVSHNSEALRAGWLAGNSDWQEFPPAEWSFRVEALQPDPYAEAKKAWKDGELQIDAATDGWTDWGKHSKCPPSFSGTPSDYRRRPTSINLDDARLVVDGNGKVVKNNYGPLTIEGAIKVLNRIN